jgi:hypothetical protein
MSIQDTDRDALALNWKFDMANLNLQNFPISAP